MTKPSRVKHTAVGVKLNDHQVHRLQAVGMSPSLNPEQLKEIGNDGITEIVDGIPSVDITLDKNQDGSMRALCLFANKNFNYGYVQVVPSGTTNIHLTFAEKYFINEMRYQFSGGGVALASYVPTSGNRICTISLTSGGSAIVTSGTNAVTPSPPTTPAGNLKIAEVYLTTNLTTIEDKHILNCHDYVTVEAEDWENADVDMIVGVKETGDSSTSDAITRTAYMSNVYLNRLDIACNTGGVSTENLAGETDNRKWLLTTKKAVIDGRAKGTGAKATWTVPTDFFVCGGSTAYPTQLDNQKYFLKVYIYNSSTAAYTDLTEVATLVDNTTFTYNSGTHVITTNYSLATTETLIVRYAVNESISEVFKRLPNPDEAHPDPPAGLMQGHIDVFLSLLPPATFNPSTASKTLRIESCTVSLGLTREALNEIGHELPYARPLTLPIPVTVTLNTTASDLEELATLCGITLASATELDLQDFSKKLYVYIYMYRETDQKRAELPYAWQPYLKKVVLQDLSVTDEAFDLRVDANATQNWTLTCDNIAITGCI